MFAATDRSRVLEATLNARDGADAEGVELSLSVENAGDDPVTLSFSDARRTEFVASQDGEEVWRWSRGRMFAQAVGEVTLSPGEVRAFEATWPDPDPGAYRVAAELAATGVELSAETTVTVRGHDSNQS